MGKLDVSVEYHKRLAFITEDLSKNLGELDKLQADLKWGIESLTECRAEVGERAERVAQSLDLNRKFNEDLVEEFKGNYMDDPLLILRDEIIQQCMIREVIARSIAIKQLGDTQIYMGLCPFHADHNPSLQINTESQKFKCLSCGESGDVVDFEMKLYKSTEKESLVKLAGIAGIDPKDFLGQDNKKA